MTLRDLLRLIQRTGRVFDFASRLHSSVNVSRLWLTCHYTLIPPKKVLKVEGKENKWERGKRIVLLSRSPISPPFINSSVGFANKYLKMPFRENRDRLVLLKWRSNILAMKPTHPYCYVIEYIVTMNIVKTARLHKQFLQS